MQQDDHESGISTRSVGVAAHDRLDKMLWPIRCWLGVEQVSNINLNKGQFLLKHLCIYRNHCWCFSRKFADRIVCSFQPCQCPTFHIIPSNWFIFRILKVLTMNKKPVEYGCAAKNFLILNINLIMIASCSRAALFPNNILILNPAQKCSHPSLWFITLWPGDDISRQRSGSTLTHVAWWH